MGKIPGGRFGAAACALIVGGAFVGGGVASAQALELPDLPGGGPRVSALQAQSASEWDGSVDTSWYSAQANTFDITSAAQLAGLAQIASGTADGIEQDSFAGKTLHLACDVVLNADPANMTREWKPIADVNTADADGSTTEVWFSGTFDGGGHAISGLCIRGQERGAELAQRDKNASRARTFGGYQGLFGALGEGAVVRNVGIESGYVSGRVAGGIAAVSHAGSAEAAPLIVGCYNKATVKANGSSSRAAGGIFGGENQNSADESAHRRAAWRATAQVVDCFNQGDVSNTSGPAGGIAGEGSVQVRGCYSSGKVETSSFNMKGALVGALFAKGYDTSDCTGQEYAYACSGAVEHSFGLDASCSNLYLGYDADHDANRPLAPSTTGSAAFLGGEALGSASARMGASFVDDSLSQPENGRYPLLWWQTGRAALGIATAQVDAIGDQRYRASAITPAVTVKAADGTSLIEGTDYCVSYADNADVGQATVTVEGLGRYEGSRSDVHFSIMQIDLASCAIDALQDQWFYGAVVTPQLTVRTQDGTKLKEGSDYKVSYSGNDKVGMATATVEAAGVGTAGTNSATFRLLEVPQKLRGSGTAEEPYLVATKGDLQFVSRAVNTSEKLEGYATAHYRLTADIDAATAQGSGRAVDPIGTKAHPFAGTFDGNGHTITLGLEYTDRSCTISDYLFEDKGDNWYLNLALFGATPDARDDKADGVKDTVSIRNLTLDGSVRGRGSVSAFMGNALAADVQFENCVNKATITYDNDYQGNEAAGFVTNPSWGSKVSFKNCRNEGDVVGNPASAGGIVGTGTSTTLDFEGCSNSGRVEGAYAAGGIMGRYKPNGNQGGFVSFEIADCANIGEVEASAPSGAAGGLVGELPSDGTTSSDVPSDITASCNAGAVSGGRSAGGVLGSVSSAPVNLNGVYNAGVVSIKNPGESQDENQNYHAGGLVGFMTGNTYSTPPAISNSYNCGALDSGAHPSGGLVGNVYFFTDLTINNSYFFSSDKVTAAYVGSCTADFGKSKVTGAGIAKSADELRATGENGMAALLGRGFEDASSPAENGGCPVLYWQHGSSRIDLSKARLSPIPDQSFSGSALRPDVELWDGGYRLKLGGDYTLSYENNTDVTTGGRAARVTVAGVGRYEGTLSATFKIVPMDISTCTVDAIGAQWASADEPARPQVRVTRPSEYISDPELKLGVDYEVGYADNGPESSKGTATITGYGNYRGRTTVEFAVNAAADGFESGRGTAADPYVVANAQQLEYLALKVNRGRGGFAQAHYKLGADVDVSAPAQVDAIGTVGAPFRGSFDGGGFAVRRVQSGSEASAGVFGVTEDAVIRNLATTGSLEHVLAYNAPDLGGIVNTARGELTMENCSNGMALSGGHYQGGLVGLAERGSALSLKGCSNTAVLGSADDMFVGGMVGCLRSARADISDCRNEAAIVVDEDGGGLVGVVLSGNGQVKLGVTRSYNVGAVTGNLNVAGLVGQANTNTALEMSSVYNNAAVTGRGLEGYTDGAGGLLGTMSAGTLHIKDVYDAGAVKGNSSALAGALVGKLESRVSSGSIENAYFTDGKAIGSNESASGFSEGGTQVSEAELKGMASTLGDAFGPDAQHVNGGFPVLTSQKADISGFAPGVIADQEYTGAEVEPSCTLVNPDTGRLLVQGTDYQIVYADNAKVGTATATLVGTGSYKGSVATQFRIVQADIAGCTVDPVPDQGLEGTGCTPDIVVTNRAGVRLVAGIDYSVSYVDNKAVGTARAVIVGKGGYRGTKTQTFRIVEKRGLSAGFASAIPAQVYTGGELEPKLELADGDAKLVEGRDYEVSYADNVEPGTAKATVTGIGTYRGSFTVTFEIERVSVEEAEVADIPEQTFDGIPVQPGLKVSLGGKALVEGADYTVRYENNGRPGTARAVIEGIGAYRGSKTVSFAIGHASIAGATIVRIADAAYTGSAIEPAVTVELGATKLRAGEDYQVVYGNNVEPGTASVTVRGTGGYSGTAQATFRIGKGRIAAGSISAIADQVSTGRPLYPSFTVTVGGSVLLAGVDYVASWSGNVEPGTGTVTVTGRGFYEGTAQASFKIAGAPQKADRGSGAGGAKTDFAAGSDSSRGVYRIAKGGTAKLVSARVGSKATGFSVPSRVCIEDKSYRVTNVAAGAFKKSKRVKTVTVGKYVKKIEASAFKGSKLSKLVVKSKKLGKKSSVKGAARGTRLKAVQIRVGGKKLNKRYAKTYAKSFSKKNLGSKAKVKVTVR